MKKSFIIIILSSIFFINKVFSVSLNDTQIINSTSSVYELFNELELKTKIRSFTQNTPLSIGELKFYLRQYENLDLNEAEKAIYDEIYKFLYEKFNLLKNEDIQVSANLLFNPELYYKTSDEVPYSFNYCFKDNLLTLPIQIGFGNLISMGSDFFVGKNQIAAAKNDNFCNIPVDFKNITSVKAMEFWFPKFAYGSVGKTFDNWGYNLQIGKMGKTVGNTLTGSIIYNSTFETDAFIDLDFYSNFLKYTLSVIQISSNRMDLFQGDNTDRYMYLHQFDIRLFKNFKFTFLEGSMTSNPFSIRYLNPLPVMHQYGGWTDYVSEDNEITYIETNFCAYMAMVLDYVPIQNLRLYLMYNQVEMQQVWERNNSWGGRYYPNSIGLQAGSEYLFNLNNGSQIKFAAEGIYTSPYLYIKQTPSSSLVRIRKDMQTKGEIYSWIGTPFGPDCVAGQFELSYIPNKKWKTSVDYVVSAKGQDKEIFDSTLTDPETGKVYYNYYPSVIWRLFNRNKYNNKLKSLLGEKYNNSEGELDEDALFEEVMRLFPNDNPIIKNEIALSAEYQFNEHLTFNEQTVFSYIINNEHINNKNDFGVQFSLALTYNLF